MTLRTKLMFVFVVPTLLLVLGYGALAYNVARSGLEDELGARLVAVGQTLSADMSGGVQARQLTRLDASKERTLKRLRQKLMEVKQETSVRRVFLFDAQRNALADTHARVVFGQRLYELDTDRFEVERVFKSRKATTSVLFTDAKGVRYKNAYVPVFADDDRLKVVAALGVEASASYFSLLTNFAGWLFALGFLGLILVAALAVVMAGMLTRPVHQLVDAARKLEQGVLDEPVVDRVMGDRAPRDELEYLGRAFEEMRCGLLSRDRQMQMMLSGIAHEVRNPLGGMELFCGLLREDLEEDQESVGRKEKLMKVQKIQRELGYLNKVVTDFLDFARHNPLNKERFLAKTLGKELETLMSGQLFEVGCTLEVDVEPQDLEIVADRERLRRALINTIRNAYQACEACDGRVILRMHEAVDDVVDRIIVLEVQDNGPGIEPERVAEMMEPFFTTKEKGSGLGLALTRKIMEQHGGKLSVKSALGDGTCVRFELPFDDAVSEPEVKIPDGWLG